MIFAIITLGYSTNLAQGLAVHISEYQKIKQYYLDNYGTENKYYQVMEAYPEYVKYGMMLPDMVYVNAGRDALVNLYKNAGGLTYELGLDEVPDPNDPNIGTISFGIDTHDYR